MAEVYKKPATGNWSPRGIVLYVLAAPLLPAIVVALIRGSFAMVAALGVSFITLLVAAKLLRSGLVAEREYNRRKIASAPPIPMKNLAAVLVGIATAITSYFVVGTGLPFSALIGVLALAGSYLAYGADPRQAKMADTGLGSVHRRGG